MVKTVVAIAKFRECTVKNKKNYVCDIKFQKQNVENYKTMFAITKF